WKGCRNAPRIRKKKKQQKRCPWKQQKRWITSRKTKPRPGKKGSVAGSVRAGLREAAGPGAPERREKEPLPENPESLQLIIIQWKPRNPRGFPVPIPEYTEGNLFEIMTTKIIDNE